MCSCVGNIKRKRVICATMNEFIIPQNVDHGIIDHEFINGSNKKVNKLSNSNV